MLVAMESLSVYSTIESRLGTPLRSPLLERRSSARCPVDLVLRSAMASNGDPAALISAKSAQTLSLS